MSMPSILDDWLAHHGGERIDILECSEHKAATEIMCSSKKEMSKYSDNNCDDPEWHKSVVFGNEKDDSRTEKASTHRHTQKAMESIAHSPCHQYGTPHYRNVISSVLGPGTAIEPHCVPRMPD